MWGENQDLEHRKLYRFQNLSTVLDVGHGGRGGKSKYSPSMLGNNQNVTSLTQPDKYLSEQQHDKGQDGRSLVEPDNGIWLAWEHIGVLPEELINPKLWSC